MFLLFTFTGISITAAIYSVEVRLSSSNFFPLLIWLDSFNWKTAPPTINYENFNEEES